MVTKGKGWEEGIDWEFGIDMYTLLYRNLLYSAGNAAQYSVIT